MGSKRDRNSFRSLGFFVFSTIFLGLFICSPSYATGIATSQAGLDWSGLSITLPDGLYFSPRTSSLNNFFSPSYSSDNGYSTGSYSNTNGLLAGYSSAAAWGSEHVSYTAFGQWQGNATYLLEGSGNGIISVSVPYNLIVDVGWTPDSNAAATAHVNLDAWLWWMRDRSWGWDNKSLSYGHYWGDWAVGEVIPLQGTFTQSGVLQASFYYDGRAPWTGGPLVLDVGYNVGAETLASVPEPSTLLLLGSGLVGLIGFRRKFQKN